MSGRQTDPEVCIKYFLLDCECRSNGGAVAAREEFRVAVDASQLEPGGKNVYQSQCEFDGELKKCSPFPRHRTLRARENRTSREGTVKEGDGGRPLPRCSTIW